MGFRRYADIPKESAKVLDLRDEATEREFLAELRDRGVPISHDPERQRALDTNE